MDEVSRPLRQRMIAVENTDDDAGSGRAQRKAVPRRALAQLVPSTRDPVEILVEQNRTRVPELVPLRFARMLSDPFSFYRGAAALMAADLAAGPSSGIEVMCGGDTHLSNFGVYASPQRTLVFDLNDFDESAVAPAEWDLKRLTTSAILGGRSADYGEKTIRRIAANVVSSYRAGLHAMLDMSILERYYLRLEPQRYADKAPGSLKKIIAGTAAKARTRTSARVFEQIMETGPDGRLQLRENPPLLQHIDVTDEAALTDSFREYLTSVPADIGVVLSHFRLTDIALRVVGVGSVGTRSYLLILTGPDGAPLVLQVKEANQSVLEEYGRRPQPESLALAEAALGHGIRVVGGQRILQAMSDVFLGTLRIGGRDFYVRQFQDMKGSVDTAGLTPEAFELYVGACAYSLARGHAQSANASLLRGYVGGGDSVTDAILEWSYAYADKTLGDFESLRKAAKAGHIEVAPDPLR
jgi:uncharacterized protein (DUF2252 family)